MELGYLRGETELTPFSAGDVSLVSAAAEVSNPFGMDGDGIFKGVFSGSWEKDKAQKSQQIKLHDHLLHHFLEMELRYLPWGDRAQPSLQEMCLVSAEVEDSTFGMDGDEFSKVSFREAVKRIKLKNHCK
ncbi:hypothetical protein CEXT_718881 [Caerostris extrusa]|uniref:Uncharacterized protein n=1 Tax=Caerostris extrusa TaxID=172846 RepID=A0AAV4PXP0_CAEEX|nr:hypothetical protein CEXT_718881 [Caerostris extrusa]